MEETGHSRAHWITPRGEWPPPSSGAPAGGGGRVASGSRTVLHGRAIAMPAFNTEGNEGRELFRSAAPFASRCAGLPSQRLNPTPRDRGLHRPPYYHPPLLLGYDPFSPGPGPGGGPGYHPFGPGPGGRPRPSPAAARARHEDAAPARARKRCKLEGRDPSPTQGDPGGATPGRFGVAPATTTPAVASRARGGEGGGARDAAGRTILDEAGRVPACGDGGSAERRRRGGPSHRGQYACPPATDRAALWGGELRREPTRLWLPEDEDHLTDLHNYVRKHCGTRRAVLPFLAVPLAGTSHSCRVVPCVTCSFRLLWYVVSSCSLFLHLF